MKSYDWILFDADETLFRFDSFSGLKLTFSKFGAIFTEQDYQIYQGLNKTLWTHYQNGEITIKELEYQRFNPWANKFQISHIDISKTFQSAMADICMPLDGAINLLNALKGQSKLGIITNGFSDLQQIRLERMGLKDYFSLVVISEQVGVPKPNRAIFDYALSKMGMPLPNSVLMVGDNLESDIVGGLNAGFDTCWLNSENKPLPPNITPSYKVTSLAELQNLLFQ